MSIKADSTYLVSKQYKTDVRVLPIQTLYPLKPKPLSGSVEVGTGGSAGSPTSLTPTSPYKYLLLVAMRITAGGTFATGETVTVDITITYSDGTTTTITKSFTATGSEDLNPSDLASLSEKLITSIEVTASSDQTSTSVTIDVDIYAFEYTGIEVIA